ncbi:MAG TPA: class I SAM-dependent methyltransferase [Gammaproteobacteria bacterium]|nr:class I SAM-dependent methyltransferase [Gammaproteobacteria bacterium]
MTDFTHRNDCRLCDSTQLDLVLPILPSAIGDAFVSKDELKEEQGTYPLDTYLCMDCGHLQNLDIVDPDILFRNYTYRTSVSLGLVEHFRAYAADVVQSLKVPVGSLVVELGSNDGSLLKAFKAQGMQVVGVDPARTIAVSATENGIPTIPEFFNSKIAKQINEKNGPAALVCANNVFAHADNLADIAQGIRSLLAPNGVFIFEVSYVPDLIDHYVFDTIYHEHLSHHALLPLERFFNRLDMTLFDVKRVQSKGGSIRGFAQPLSTGQRPKSELLKNMMAEEERRKITGPEIYRNFFQAIEERKRATLAYLDQARQEGKTVAAYGASTTTTTLLYHFELGERLDYIVDDNPIKQNLFSPGLHLPVLASSELYVRRPNVVVILAWIYADPIIKRHQRFIEEGGEFLIPLPEMKIIS